MHANFTHHKNATRYSEKYLVEKVRCCWKESTSLSHKIQNNNNNNKNETLNFALLVAVATAQPSDTSKKKTATKGSSLRGKRPRADARSLLQEEQPPLFAHDFRDRDVGLTCYGEDWGDWKDVVLADADTRSF